MIRIKSLASGSAGNCYHISDGETSLLIEAGITIREIKKGLDFKLSGVTAVLISHEHQDHCKAVKEITEAGIDVYSSPGTISQLEGSPYRLIKFAKDNNNNFIQKEIGSWIVKPFRVKHDCEEPIGFIIYSKATTDNLVYITDSQYTIYKFADLNYLMIECNYAKELLDENISNGRVHQVQKNRLLQTHFSLKTVLDLLEKNDLNNLKEIWLLHLSEINADDELFKKAVQKKTGVPVYIA